MTELFAKSAYSGRPALTLARHCRDTEDAALALFRLDGRWGRNFCRFFQLDSAASHAFLLNLRVAALFHDVGKANEDFQRAVSGPSFSLQSLRHEHISALVLCLDDVRAWLAHNPSLDADVITAAVLSHHLKAKDPRDASDGWDAIYRWCQSRDKPVVSLSLDHPQVAEILARVAEIAKLPPPLTLPRAPWRADRGVWAQALSSGCRRATKLRRAIRRDLARRALLAAVKAGVIAADSAASGLVRVGHDINEWIEDVAHARPLDPADVQTSILDPRGEQLARKRGAPFTLHAFQRRAAELGPRALLLAGCGSGKTIAAWNWARAQLADRQLGHIIFLYPTRGTATEGFRDYVGWAPEDQGALVHGTAAFELHAMAENPDDDAAASIRGKRVALTEAEQRLFALGLWSRRYFSATVDQFLAFLDHRYESLCALPLLADSAVILDEIHSYDRSMFRNLCGFLREFDIPVLCMTATLPTSRRRQLDELGLRVYPTETDRAELADLEAAEAHPRYRVAVIDEGEALDRVLDAYRAGQRVLWVVNTVARCQERAQQLMAALDRPVLVYHSRFRLADRRRQHQETVAAFQQRDRPALAVTTQVCEMSLDLDADVLITETAPISSLVQRFGRANRHARPGDEFRAAVHVYEPPKVVPYARADIDAALAFLAEIAVGEVSQRTLAEALERHAPREADAARWTRFLTSGYYATPGDFRDADEFSRRCVLDTDLEKLAAVSDDRRAFKHALLTAELGVPAKSADIEPPPWLPPYLGVAPGERYTSELGFWAGELP